MSVQIHPAMLKALRKRLHKSQEELAKSTEKMCQKVGIATIKRIEASDNAEPYMATRTVAERLAKTLGVGVEDLARRPTADDAEDLRESSGIGKRKLRISIDQSSWLAFRMVEHRYGVPLRDQVEMAPLCMALLAEGSLVWRKRRLAKIYNKVEELHSLGGGNFSFANVVWRVDELGNGEDESIRKRDLFGENIHEETYGLGYDPNVNNPFADYLRKLGEDLHRARDQDADTRPDLSIDVEEPLKSSGFPDFMIGSRELSELTNHDVYADYAIAFGHARISEIPAELLGEGNVAERTKWLVSCIPDKELAELEAEHARATEELLAMFASPSETSGETGERQNG